VFPAIIVSLMDVQQSWAMFGGTSLIMVGVAIDTIQQINSYLLNNKHYDGLMKSGKIEKQ
jgi:preprotein translocase subunit SecY